MASKYNIASLNEEEKEQLKEYIDSIAEIKRAIGKLVKKGKAPKEIKEKKIGGNNSTGLHYKLNK